MSTPRRPKIVAPRAKPRVLAGDESRHSSDQDRHSSDETRHPLVEESEHLDPGLLARLASTPPAELSKPARERGVDTSDGIAIRHMRRPTRDSLAPAPPPIEPWQPGAQRHRPRERSFMEDARDILACGVPLKLRALVATRTGLPLDVCAAMSLRQAIILVLLADALEKGQLDKLDRVLDRTDPKSRRVEHSGGVAHLHAVAGALAGMSEADAADLYRQLIQSPAIDVDVVEGEGG